MHAILGVYEKSYCLYKLQTH